MPDVVTGGEAGHVDAFEALADARFVELLSGALQLLDDHIDDLVLVGARHELPADRRSLVADVGLAVGPCGDDGLSVLIGQLRRDVVHALLVEFDALVRGGGNHLIGDFALRATGPVGVAPAGGEHEHASGDTGDD